MRLRLGRPPGAPPRVPPRPRAAPRATCGAPPSSSTRAERPIIFCRPRHHRGRARASCCASSSRRRGSPSRRRCSASAASRRRTRSASGMMGMHGEAWVNQAIQEADLLIALGMRFDDRVTGKLETYAPKAKKIHCELDPAEINKNVRVDVPLVGDVGETLRALLPAVAKRERARVDAAHRRAQGRLGGARHPDDARQRPPLRRARDARPLAHHRGQGARRHRRRPAPDVGGAVLQARLPAASSSRRAASARWASRCRRRSARSSRGPTRRSGSSSATAASR